MSDAVRPSALTLVDFRARPVRQPLTQRSRGQRALQLSIAAGDLAIVSIATTLAAAGRTRLTVFDETTGVNVIALSIGGYVVLGWMLMNVLVGSYDRSALGVGTTEYARICSSAAVTASLMGITSYLTKFPLSRGFFVLLFALAVPALVAWRYAGRQLVHSAHSKGHLLTRVLISGDPQHVDDVAKVLSRESWLGYQIVGALLPHGHRAGITGSGIPVVGRVAETAEAVGRHLADVVVFAEGSFATPADFRHVAWDLEGRDVQMVVVPSLSDISAERVTMRPVGGLPLVLVEQPQSLGASRGLKRAFDIVGTLSVLVLALPIMAALAVAIRLEDGGPVLFRQTRVGRDGRLFECLKFRSMVVDAEARLAEIRHLNRSVEGVLFKLTDDPRVTRVGKLIRRLSLDELPQLFNVLRGDMSLVGPRPALPSEVHRYDPDVRRRLHVRPGLTGLWQVSGRSDLSWEDTVRLDLYYVDNWSIVQDVAILLRTVHAVLASRGAY
ncbi:MAG TPA: sugar transferase [Intrasporangium sp.]|uniref:sugar transferase n=1 Tax=Intrasporangium sp. TaxID=1925024 RepID=UPI002D77D596|nr:sugar transferase [Intrasporangium sp.]HET7400068.1 sugar transferase [Intrasporangium sp.]